MGGGVEFWNEMKADVGVTGGRRQGGMGA